MSSNQEKTEKKIGNKLPNSTMKMLKNSLLLFLDGMVL